MENLWWLFAFFTSITLAVYLSINQYFKMNASLLMIYRGLFVAAVMLPLMFFFPLVSNPVFYLYCTLQGIVIAYLDNRFFAAAERFGSELTSAIQPFSVGLVFVVWVMLNPWQIEVLSAYPLHFLVLIASLAGIIFAAVRLSHAPDVRKALLVLWPLLIALVLSDTLNKKSMVAAGTEIYSGLYYYNFIMALVSGICNLVLYLFKKQPVNHIFNPLNLKRGLVVVIVILALGLLKSYTMYLSFNPAYASAVILTAPLWIVTFNNICRSLNNSALIKIDYTTVLLLIGSVIMLVIATGGIKNV